jgi:hypothetical protein
VSLLLDTCTLLWFLSNDPKLSETARAATEEPANVRWVSPGSLFEIAIKVRRWVCFRGKRRHQALERQGLGNDSVALFGSFRLPVQRPG